MPERVQRRRDTPLPAGAVCVDRSTRYGNPYAVRRRLVDRPETEDHEHAGSATPGRWEYVVVNTHSGEEVQVHRGRYGEPRQAAYAQAVELFETITLPARLEKDPRFLEPLQGKDLADSAPSGIPSHADVLLRAAAE